MSQATAWKCSKSGQWCDQDEGVCTARTWAVITGLLSLGFMLSAILVPIAIDKMIDDALCESLCIPTLNDPAWMYESWRTTDNDTMNPPMYVEFYLYNITNLYDAIVNGDMMELDLVGPYTYKLRQEKYDVEYNSDWSEVWYSMTNEYTFEPNMSVGLESDEFWNVDLPFLGGAWLFYSTEGVALDFSERLLCDVTGDERTAQACLFGKRNVTESIFNQFSADIAISGKLYFENRPMNPYFQFWERCYSNQDCYTKDTDRYNFGLGGKCELVYPNNGGGFQNGSFIPYQFCKDPSRTNGTDTRDHLYTGHGSFDDLWKYIHWHGNDSIWFWNVSTNPVTNETEGLEYVTDTHLDLQWNTYMDEGDILSTWDETGLRRVTLQYAYEHEEYGITLWRFRTTDDLYNNSDPHYFGTGLTGFLNASTPSLIVHGSTSPTLVSMAFMAGVTDPNVTDSFICNNCPEINPNLTRDELNIAYGSFLDVQPTLGKVLAGQKKIQITNYLSQDFLCNQTIYDKTHHCKYGKIGDVYLPYVIYNFSASFNDTQADIVQDGLDLLDLAHALKLACLVIFPIFCFALAVGCYRLYKKWKQVMEPEQITGHGYQRVN